MRGRFALAALLVAAPAILATPLGASVASPSDDTFRPTAEAIFKRAKDVWRERREAPYVAYSLLERYSWRSRVHDNWWRGTFRSSDDALSLHRIVVPEQEAARMRGTAIGINLRWHSHGAHADSLDTNPDADAFPVLDPLVEPNASFGLLRHERVAELAGPRSTVVIASAAPATPVVTASPTTGPEASATAAPSSGGTKPLRQLARVEAVARDYRIALAGSERVHDVDAYHLVLTPLRDPHVYRLRDLWIGAADYATLRLAVEGLFAGRPYDAARWTVTYAYLDGRAYVQQIKTADTLRFGLDRYVDGLEYDFISYEFPPAVASFEFDRML